MQRPAQETNSSRTRRRPTGTAGAAAGKRPPAADLEVGRLLLAQGFGIHEAAGIIGEARATIRVHEDLHLAVGRVLTTRANALQAHVSYLLATSDLTTGRQP
jgi:hypothetical protein